MNASHSSTPVPARRCIVLGASNVARNFSIVLATARGAANAPIDFLTAMGHGRGYGMRSCVLGRALPPILNCGLWEALEHSSTLPTWSLVTDIGNDLIYGVSPDQVSAWVEAVLTRLASYSERLVVTGLPLCVVRTLGPKRFHFFRTIFFPQSQLTFADVSAASCELNERVAQLAERFGAAFIEPVEAWYGWDPIHVTRRQATAAWQHLFAAFASLPARPRITWYMRRTAYFARPLFRRQFGIPQHCPQPSSQWPDGSTISMF